MSTPSPAIPPDLPAPRLSRASAARAGSLRLAVDLSHLRPGGENGGVKALILEYLRQLAALEQDDLVCIFLTRSDSHAEVRQWARPCDELVCVRHGDAANPPDADNWRNGELFVPAPPANLLLLLEADVFYAPLISAEFACPGIPTLSTFVDVLHRDYPETLSPADNQYREQMFGELLRVSDRLQCNSQYTADRLSRLFGVPPERMFSSYLATQDWLVRAVRESDSPPAEPYFLYPANSWRHKNHATLLVAYRQYREKHGAAAWRLVLTGHEDDGMRRIVASIRHLGLEPAVSFRGHLSTTEFSRVWQQAGALVFPSLHEGFGNPLVEAMHFGVPILSSTAGSLPEVAGDAALYADARDPAAWAAAMLEMATRPDLRAALVARGRRRLAEFSPAEEVAEFREAIRALARSPARRWHKGIYSDSWTEGLALLGLPPGHGTRTVTLRFGPQPAARRVRLYHGLVPLGGFEVPASATVQHVVEMPGGTAPLVVEVPDAANLNPSDRRAHGVILNAAVALDGQGRQHDLLEEEPL